MNEFVLGVFFGSGITIVLCIIIYILFNVGKGFSSRIVDFASPKYPRAEPVEQENDDLGINDLVKNRPYGKVGEQII